MDGFDPASGPVAATRFAPSPTGPLHLGHGWSALVALAIARAGGGRFLLRIDDIDPGRCRAEYRAGIDTDLAWLGLVPDGPPLVQSTRFAAYRQALDTLTGMGLTYPCFCTRSDIAASAAAPHGPPHGPAGPLYPGTCRHLGAAEAAARIASGAPHAIRLSMDAAVAEAEGGGPLVWRDGLGIEHDADPAGHGDIILARRDSPSSYHLASTVDDAHLGISHVVRGADLRFATPVHVLLQRLLALPSPVYIHHRLVTGADGRRLAKRDNAATLAGLRDAGTDPAALVAAMQKGQLPLGYGWSDA